MPTTPVQALPYPSLSDPANGPVGFQNLALALEDYKTLIRCTSSTRPAHVEGRVIYETDTDTLLVSTGAAWVVVSQEKDAAVVMDPNVSPLWNGSRVYVRGRMATLAMEFKVNISFGNSWTLLTAPAGYRPIRKIYFSIYVNNLGTTVGGSIDVDGAVRGSETIQSGSDCLSHVTYPIA